MASQDRNIVIKVACEPSAPANTSDLTSLPVFKAKVRVLKQIPKCVRNLGSVKLSSLIGVSVQNNGKHGSKDRFVLMTSRE